MMLAAPALSTSGALTGLNGTSPAVGFPPGYGATLAATTLAAAGACLGISRARDLVAYRCSP